MTVFQRKAIWGLPETQLVVGTCKVGLVAARANIGVNNDVDMPTSAAEMSFFMKNSLFSKPIRETGLPPACLLCQNMALYRTVKPICVSTGPDGVVATALKVSTPCCSGFMSVENGGWLATAASPLLR